MGEKKKERSEGRVCSLNSKGSWVCRRTSSKRRKISIREIKGHEKIELLIRILKTTTKVL